MPSAARDYYVDCLSTQNGGTCLATSSTQESDVIFSGAWESPSEELRTCRCWSAIESKLASKALEKIAYEFEPHW